MGFSNPESGCRRHPNQKRLPGVCSFCLRERLSRLSSENNSYKTSNSSFSDSSSSASSSPPSRRHNHHRRNGSAAAAPVGFVVHHGAASYHNNNGNGNGVGDVGVGSSGLKKSRSVAWAPTSFRMLNRYGNVNGKEDEKDDKDEKSGKKGLWKKLVHSTSKKTKGVLMHSMTIKERSQNGHSNSYHRF